MDPAVLAGLAVLALVDSTSFGTLGVPVWMLVQPQVRGAAVLTYLGVIAAFYWALGLGLLAGAHLVTDALDGLATFTASRPLLWTQLLVGAGMLALSFVLDRRWSERRRARRGDHPSRVQRWTARAVGPEATLGTVSGIALGAGLVEAASMLPYLAAIALLTTAGLGFAANAGLLVAYVVVMVLPGLALLGLRLAAHDRASGPLTRVNGWLQRGKDELLGWTLGILGLLVALDAATRLGLLG